MIPKDLLPLEVVESEREGDWALNSTLHLERAARRLDLEDWIVQRLKHPEREMTVNLVSLRDNGEAFPCSGFRVQHSTARGLGMGPVLLSPDAHLQRLRALAAAATWQWALLDIPLGGSAGAVVCDPRDLSERELRQVAKDYVAALGEFIGPFTDVLTPDGGNRQVVAWMLDGYARGHGRGKAGVVAGKPAALLATPWLCELSGLAMVVLVTQALAERNQNLPDARVAVQGFGPLGSVAARWLADAGARVIALADASGGLLREGGIDMSSTQSYAAQHRVLFGYPEAEAVSNAEVLESPCDVLVTAAAEGQITLRNAARIQASILIEAAHGAITESAETLLVSKGTFVVPDLLVCAASSLPSFLEWRQSVHFTWMERAEAEQAVRRRTALAYKTVSATAKERELGWRQACYLLAADRVAAALRLR